MPNSAVLSIDGERKLLRVGQSFKGVTLVGADAANAILEIEGQTITLGLSQRIGTKYAAPSATVVTITRNRHYQYQTLVQVNGRTVLALVDTGANVVAMSRAHADALGVDYRLGEPSQVQTASGVAPANVVNLRSVNVGGIQVENVRATVIEGNYPSDVLLGMSFLQHVTLNEKDGVLTMSSER